jgi:hypothetical protein
MANTVRIDGEETIHDSKLLPHSWHRRVALRLRSADRQRRPAGRGQCVGRRQGGRRQGHDRGAGFNMSIDIPKASAPIPTWMTKTASSTPARLLRRPFGAAGRTGRQ